MVLYSYNVNHLDSNILMQQQHRQVISIGKNIREKERELMLSINNQKLKNKKTV
jgi:hypothetical protein